MKKTIYTTYQPKTLSAIEFFEPEKAEFLKNYFGGFLPKSTSIPTVNLTLGIISPDMKQVIGSVGEYLAVKKSCDRQLPIKTNKGSNHEILNGCIFAYVADLPMSVLRMIAFRQAFVGTYDATMIALQSIEKEKQYKKDSEKLHKVLEALNK